MYWDAIEKEEEDDEDNEGLESNNIDEEFIKWQRDTPPVQAATNISIQSCKTYFYLNREVSVDEAVKKFKGSILKASRCTLE